MSLLFDDFSGLVEEGSGMTTIDGRLLVASAGSVGMGIMHLHVYQNDITPAEGTVLADFIECDFPGYLPADCSLLTAPGFDSPSVASWRTTDPVHIPTLDEADPDQPGFGMYITDSSDTVLYYASRFIDMFMFQFGGFDLAITPRWTIAAVE
jgi:hypothetical protein